MLQRICLWLGLIAIFAGPAAAQTVHEVQFTNPARVMVWHDGALIGQGGAVQLSAPSAVPVSALIGPGQLEALTDTSPDGRLVVRIASNAGFTLQTETGYETRNLSVQVLGHGPNAQVQIGASAGDRGAVFTHLSKTARSPGAPESQGIDLEITWRGAAPALWVQAAAS